MTIFILVSILLVAAFAIAMFVGVSPTSQIVKVQPNEIYHQQELMYYVYSYFAFSNIGKKGRGIVSFLCQFFQVYFPAGESAVSKKVPEFDKVKERREKPFYLLPIMEQRLCGFRIHNI